MAALHIVIYKTVRHVFSKSSDLFIYRAQTCVLHPAVNVIKRMGDVEPCLLRFCLLSRQVATTA